MNKVKRMDFVSTSKGMYLVTKQGRKLMLWDFRVWLDGYYDAYIPIPSMAGRMVRF